MIRIIACARSRLMRVSFLCLAVLTLVPLGAGAQSACRVLDPELAGIYRGGCKDGFAEGSGEAKGTAEYRGEFRTGRKHGKGVKTWATGDRYEGDFVDDRKEGMGKYTWSARGPSAGESYSGAYLNDRRHGQGVYAWPSGDRYEGPWENDAAIGPPTPMMIARARAKTETLAAVGKPGVKVCRVVPVGIAVRDWIRGEVTGADADKIAVRIEDPGSHPHTVGEVGWSPSSAANVPLVKGLAFWSEAAEWTPCL